jgi:hypothetical protein
MAQADGAPIDSASVGALHFANPAVGRIIS